MKIKVDFNSSIDGIGDGHFWNNLNKDEKKELLIAYKESFDVDNLLSHEHVKLQHEKWLKPLT